MKKISDTIKVARVAIIVLIGLVTGCKDDSTQELKLSRQFSTAGFKLTNGETQVTVEWLPSLFTLPGEPQYAVEFSTDPSDFSNSVFTTTTNDVSVVVTDETLAIKKDYYARVKTIGANGSDDSNWSISPAFRILGEQFLLAVPDADVIDNKAILRWKTNPALTRIVITPAGGQPFEVTLTAADHTTQQKLISSLAPNTTYTAEIFQDAKSKGTVSFKTKAAITGSSVIDLRGKTGRPLILLDTLPSIPSGSIVVLNRNQTYNLSSVYALNKSVTIMSGLDFGTNKAKILTTSNFNIALNSTIDSIVFQDVQIKGGNLSSPGSFGANYLINASNAATVGKVRLENCIIKMVRGVVRGQAGGTGTKYGTYIVNNCVIDSVNDFAIAAASGASSFANIKITNSTIYKTRKLIIHEVTGAQSVLIENCTINEGANNNGNNYLISFNTFNVTNGVTIRNTIIGKTWIVVQPPTPNQILGYRAGTSTTLTVANSYATSDFALDGAAIPGINTYSSPSTTLFTDPDKGNFKIKDAAFAGKSSAGDPRWR